MEKGPFLNNEDFKQRYYERTRKSVPNREAVDALSFVINKDVAIDIGSGAMTDVNYFAREGFNRVYALDINLNESFIDPENRDRVVLDNSDINNFAYPENSFDFIYARASLHYIHPLNFDRVFSAMKNSVRPQGVFALKMLGQNDSWNTGVTSTFKSLEQIKEYLSDFDLLVAAENEKDGETALGLKKHWHIIKIVARRK